jgi:hypothetical protein
MGLPGVSEDIVNRFDWFSWFYLFCWFSWLKIEWNYNVARYRVFPCALNLLPYTIMLFLRPGDTFENFDL